MPRRPLLILLLVISLAGCSRALIVGGGQPSVPATAAAQTTEPRKLANGTVVDGVQVGDPIDCGASANCREALKFAETAAIKTRSLVANSIAATSVYEPYVPPNMASTGGGYVVVYDLTDGSQMAVRLYCFVGPCQVVPRQPLIDTLATPSDYSNPQGGSPAPDDPGESGGIPESSPSS